MSLSLVAFYGLKGLVSLCDASTISRGAAIRPSQFFAFTEIPAIFSAVYFGLKFLPEWLVGPYEWILLASSPIFVLLEGLSSMIIILECGEQSSEILADASVIVKSLVALVCFGIFGVSFRVVGDVYSAGLFFVASVCTVLLGLTGLTVFVEHGTITDAAMLCLYVTYNIWCITRSWKDHFMSAVKIESVFDYLSNPSKLLSSSIFAPSNNTLLAAITSLASMFSVEIVVHLMTQMCVFVVAVKLIGKAIRKSRREADSSESGSEEDLSTDSWLAYQDWIFNVLWPSFGKLLLVLVYTYAWILHTKPELVSTEFSWYNPTTWRYVNAVMVLLIYLKHLLTPPEEPVLFKLE